MRLPVVHQISTKDGTTNKNARLFNALKESNKTGDFAVIRPGLMLDAVASGVGNGLVAFNDELVSVYGATIGFIDGAVELSDWVFTDPFISTFTVHDVANFNNKYLVTGTSASEGTDYIFSSVDGLSWANVYDLAIVVGGAPLNNTILTFAASDSLIVGLYYSGPVDGPYEIHSVVSSDGVTWATHSVSTNTYAGLGILWDGTYFIANGENELIKSTDGINWTTAGSLPAGNLIGFDRGNWAVLDDKIIAVFQDDGSGDLVFWVSNDHAATWTQCVQFAESSPVTSGNGKFVTIRENGAPDFDIYDSTDGLTWTNRATITAVGLSLDSTISFSNGLFLAWTGGSLLAGDTGVYATSEDAETWTTFPQAVFSGFWTPGREVATDNGFLMYGSGASIGIASVLENIAPITTINSDRYDFVQSPL